MAPDIDEFSVFFLFSLSVACDTVVGAVKLQFLMASKILFMFSSANTTLQQSCPLAVVECF